MHVQEFVLLLFEFIFISVHDLQSFGGMKVNLYSIYLYICGKYIFCDTYNFNMMDFLWATKLYNDTELMKGPY